MTEGRKDGIKDGATVEALRWAMQTFSGWTPFLIISNLIGALNTLRDRIEKDQTGELRRHPFLQLDYDLPKLSPEEKNKIDAEGDVANGINALLEKDFPDILAWLQLTQGVSLQVGPPKEDGSASSITVRVPPEAKALNEKLDAMTEDQRKAEMARLSRGWTIEEWGIKPPIFSRVAAEGEIEFEAAVAFRVLPLTVLHDGSRSFFPVLIGLEISKGELPAPSSLAWAEFWGQLIDFFTPLLQNLYKQLQDKTVAKLIPIPSRKPDQVRPVKQEYFPVASSYNPLPIFKLTETGRSGLPLHLEKRQQFLRYRTPLNWAVGLAFFYFTSEKDPGGWQKVRVSELENRIYNLMESGETGRTQQREDILAEAVKLHTQKNYYLKYGIKRFGKVWSRDFIGLGSEYVISSLELFYKDKGGEIVSSTDHALRKIAIDLEVNGRRVTSALGKDIKALPKDRFTLHSIGWRWNPVYVDDLKAVPLFDKKGRIMKDKLGRVIRSGWNVKVPARIFAASAKLRAEKAYVAHNLLILVCHDIYKPPPQSKKPRNTLEREAERLYAMLNLEYDPKHPDRREEAVEKAIFRLKQPDIAALLPGSDERPRLAPDSWIKSGRRKNPIYHLVRSPLFMPAGILLSKEQAKDIEGEEDVPALPPIQIEAAPKIEIQKTLPFTEKPKPIPTGTEIRAARSAAGVNIRDFARMMKGPSFKTWSMMERGERNPGTGRIDPAVWQRVRDFVEKHKPKDGK